MNANINLLYWVSATISSQYDSNKNKIGYINKQGGRNRTLVKIICGFVERDKPLK